MFNYWQGQSTPVTLTAARVVENMANNAGTETQSDAAAPQIDELHFVIYVLQKSKIGLLPHNHSQLFFLLFLVRHIKAMSNVKQMLIHMLKLHSHG